MAARFSEIQHGIHGHTGHLEHFSEFGFEYEHCEGELQPQAPDDDARPDGTALCGEQISSSQDGHDAEQAGKATHLESDAETRGHGEAAKTF